MSHEGSHDGVEARKRNNRMDGQTVGGYLGGHLARLECSGFFSKSTVASTVARIDFSLSSLNQGHVGKAWILRLVQCGDRTRGALPNIVLSDD